MPLVLSSSIQVEQGNQYGNSKLAAEKIVEDYSKRTGASHYIYRLPNVFGKWCKPNYNSFVATFCYNVMNGIELSIRDPNAEVTLVSIDDVCESFIELLTEMPHSERPIVSPEYSTTVGEVATLLTSFKSFRCATRASSSCSRDILCDSSNKPGTSWTAIQKFDFVSHWVGCRPPRPRFESAGRPPYLVPRRLWTANTKS